MTLITRSIFEIRIYLCYILEANTENRAIAHQVFYLRKAKQFFERTDPKTEIGATFHQTFKSDMSGPVFTEPLPDNSVQIKNLQKILDTKPFQNVNEYFEKRELAKRKNTECYEYDSGITNFRSLCEHFALSSLYDYFYKTWSDESHANAKNPFTLTGFNNDFIELLRSTHSYASFVLVAAQNVFDAFESTIQNLLPSQHIRLIRYGKNQFYPLMHEVDQFMN